VKPAKFEYFAPTSLDEALELLTDDTAEVKVLAGGQSLVPAMNFRLATPEALVDLNHLPGNDRVRLEDSELVVEMLARHVDLETPIVDDPAARLLARASHFVGHLPIRVRGTVAGSLAHADPAAEWCMLAVALDATVVAQSTEGVRRLAAADFFDGPFSTGLTPQEVITETRWPLLGRAGIGFHEQSRTAGDFATVAVAAVLAQGDSGTRARIAIAGAESYPSRVATAEEVLARGDGSAAGFAEAASAAAEVIDPIGDASCSAGYRRHLVEVLVRRALEDAQKQMAT